ncbi:hypothetical protein RQP46_005634 [Phenoliferia psychrophenolica]
MSETIAIIGGGIIGVSCAYFLAHHAKLPAGTRIVIVEGSDVAAGASGKAGGLLALDWHGASTASLARLSYSLHASLSASHSGPTLWDYRPLTTLSISADLSSPPPPSSSSSWLSPSILASSSTLGTPSTTAQVHPAKFTRALLDLSLRTGNVEVRYGTVTSFSGDTSKGFALEIQPKGGGEPEKLKADKVVVAAGPWTGTLLKGMGVKGRASRIGGERAHSVVVRTSEERPPLPAQALFTSIKTKGVGAGTHEPEIYNRPDGTAYACGPTDSSPLPPLASDVKVDPLATRAILSQIAALSPSYFTLSDDGAKVEVEQACYLPTGSGDPVIGKVKEGVWVASGHSCWGICNGPGTGLCVAELILDGKATSADISKLGV